MRFLYFLFGFLLAFNPFTGIPTILIGILFVKIDTKIKLAYSLLGLVLGTMAGIFLWGDSWILEQLKWGYQEQGAWGFVGGTLVLVLLSLIVARTLHRN